MAKKNLVFIALFSLIINLAFCLNISRAGTDEIPQLSSESAVLMDAATGQVLFEKNMHQRQYPASITKIMTGLLAIENAGLNDAITMSHDAVFTITPGSSHIALDTGERLTLKDALYALSIESANDAANGIAEYIGGDMGKFAQMMTDRAGELGALDTNFANAHGLDDKEHYTTAYDMALIMQQAVKSQDFRQIFGAAYYEMAPTNLQTEPRSFHSKNRLLNGLDDYKGIIASKLGWTSKANNTLVSAAAREGRELIVVVMNNQAHNGIYADTRQLFDYGFDEFRETVLLTAEAGESLPVFNKGQVDGTVNIKTAEPVIRLLHKSVPPQAVEVSYEILDYSDGEGFRTHVALRLKQENDYMYRDLGSLILFTPVDLTAEEISGAADVLKILKLVFMVLGGFIILLLILRQINQHRLRRKRTVFRDQYRITSVPRSIGRDSDSSSRR